MGITNVIQNSSAIINIIKFIFIMAIIGGLIWGCYMIYQKINNFFSNPIDDLKDLGNKAEDAIKKGLAAIADETGLSDYIESNVADAFGIKNIPDANANKCYKIIKDTSYMHTYNREKDICEKENKCLSDDYDINNNCDFKNEGKECGPFEDRFMGIFNKRGGCIKSTDKCIDKFKVLSGVCVFEKMNEKCETSKNDGVLNHYYNKNGACVSMPDKDRICKKEEDIFLTSGVRGEQSFCKNYNSLDTSDYMKYGNDIEKHKILLEQRKNQKTLDNIEKIKLEIKDKYKIDIKDDFFKYIEENDSENYQSILDNIIKDIENRYNYDINIAKKISSQDLNAQFLEF